MAYIDLKTGKALSHHEDIHEEFIIPEHLNMVEIDEFIAPAIFLLNQKGYETLYSCSGHMYPFLGYFYRCNDLGEEEKMESYETDCTQCYIVFKEMYEFPVELPEGFHFDSDRKIAMIEKDHKSKPGTIERMTEIVETMQKLYYWAEKL